MPAPAVAAAAKAAASKPAEEKSKQEHDSDPHSDELVPTEVYEERSTETTTTSGGGGFSLGSAGKNETSIILLLVLAGVVIFIQHDRSGKAQSGTQFAALGVVGFILLVLANFVPSLALVFTVLFVVSIVLNSPNGIPVIGNNSLSSLLTPNEPVSQPTTTQGAVPHVTNSAGIPLNKTTGEVAQ